MMKDEERVQDGLQSLSVKNESNMEDEVVVAMKKEQEGDSDAASSADHSKHSQSHSPSTSPDEPKSSSDSASIPDKPRPKVSRKTSHKRPPRPVTLFSDLPDVTEESKSCFQVIPECLYGSKSLGSTEHDSLDCDCNEDWHDGENHACGDDSDCINRATKMECIDRECNCGDGCQNQRFQRKQYADVSVIKTEKKGFGLRANAELQTNDFIFEYIGEVINEPTFRRRMLQYDQENIKHFYFMSLTKNEFVDATKKGNLGRFCNHSCNPNCYVDKWVVGNKLRMGIFAGRTIQAGEELVFNYNVDRYGADPQPCYCGEPNCIGFIGGKTQSGRATKLSDATIQALGLDDADGWDTTVAVVKKPRKKRVNEDDEEYVNSVEARGLDERGVQKVMAALVQCKEKWIAVKLLERIQRGDDSLLPYVVRMHGYEFLKTTLNTFKDDHNVVLQILDILYRFPRLTRNKITDSKIETVVQPLTESQHDEVAEESKRLLDEWSKLETGYRIPRKNRNAQGTPNTHPTNSFEDRRGMRGEEPLHKAALSTPLPDNVPKGPRSAVPQRNASFFNQRHHRRPPDQASLPQGWFIATDKTGRWYFYTHTGVTQWQRPTEPAPDALHKGPSKAMQEQKTLQDIIDSLTKPESAAALRRSASQTPQQANTPVQETKQESWRSLPIEKQKRIYENTVFQHVKPVMDRYRRKLSKEEWKHHAKEATKTLVAKDYKHNRVSDPHAISEKWAKAAKTFAQEWFEKAVKRQVAREKDKADRTGKSGNGPDSEHITPLDTTSTKDDMNGALSDEEDIASTPASSDRKRKREETELGSASVTPSETPSLKRVKEDAAGVPTPPPPPPPPPEGDTAVDVEMTEQHQEQQDEVQKAAQAAERQKLREQEAALERENELNMLDFEREQQKQHEVLSH